MKNLYTILAFAIVVPLTLIPPIDFFFTNPFTDKWFLLIFICGFSGLYMIYIKTNPIVKIIAIASFIQCFFSAAPFISFTSYISIILCCYFYVCCSRIENWKVIFQMLQVVMFLNLLMVFMQTIGKDNLLNWGHQELEYFGIIGQHMQMASFGVILSAVLISFNPLNFIFPFLIAIFCKSSWAILSSGIGFGVYLFSKNIRIALVYLLIIISIFSFLVIKQHKISENFSSTGRVRIWSASVQIASQRPLAGWGAGTYKFIFPQVSRHMCANMTWKTSHNFIAQLLFEVGFIMTGFILFCIGYLVHLAIKTKQWLILSGIGMMLTDSLVHFPDRMPQTVPLIILFIALCERKIRYGYFTE